VDKDGNLTVTEVLYFKNRLEHKRKSRVWFDPDVELLNDLCEAERILTKVAGQLAIEGLPRG
jgi:hypothetical protein